MWIFTKDYFFWVHEKWTHNKLYNKYHGNEKAVRIAATACRTTLILKLFHHCISGCVEYQYQIQNKTLNHIVGVSYILKWIISKPELSKLVFLYSFILSIEDLQRALLSACIQFIDQLARELLCLKIIVKRNEFL